MRNSWKLWQRVVVTISYTMISYDRSSSWDFFTLEAAVRTIFTQAWSWNIQWQREWCPWRIGARPGQCSMWAAVGACLWTLSLWPWKTWVCSLAMCVLVPEWRPICLQVWVNHSSKLHSILSAPRKTLSWSVAWWVKCRSRAWVFTIYSARHWSGEFVLTLVCRIETLPLLMKRWSVFINALPRCTQCIWKPLLTSHSWFFEL